MPDQDVFAALANPTRRALLDLLRDRPRPVHELAEQFAMRRPSVSEHLRVLREAGLVADERRGRQRVYRVEPERLREIAEWLHPYEEFWRDRLRGLRELLDEEEGTA
jgi:DNA-binding transcriptional ArsR family regulator